MNFWLGLAGWSISIAYTLVFVWVFLGDEIDGTVSREISITDLTEKLAEGRGLYQVLKDNDIDFRRKYAEGEIIPVQEVRP